MKDYKKETINFMRAHKFLSLATTDESLKPWAASLGYANDEKAIVYFATNKNTLKIKHINKNQNVAYVIDPAEDTDWSELQGIQMQALAKIVTDSVEIEKAHNLLNEKFPEFANMPQDADMIIVKAVPVKGHFLDCTVEFGFSADLEY